MMVATTEGDPFATECREEKPVESALETKTVVSEAEVKIRTSTPNIKSSFC